MSSPGPAARSPSACPHDWIAPQHGKQRLSMVWCRHVVVIAVVVFWGLAAADNAPGPLAAAYNLTAQTPEDVHLFVSQAGSWAGGNRQVLLKPGLLSLANVTFPFNHDANSTAGTSGELAILPENSSLSTVLDSAMRAWLSPRPAGATVLIQGFTLINLCEVLLTQTNTRIIELISAEPLALIPRNQTYRSQKYQNLTMYLRRADVMQIMYLLAAERTPFPAVAAQTGELWTYGVHSGSRIGWVTEYDFLMQAGDVPQGHFGNVIFKSIENPDDPLIQSPWAQQHLMAPTFCNGSALPARLKGADVDTAAALWASTNTSTFVQALRKAWTLAITTVIGSLKPPPFLMLAGQVAPVSLGAGTLPVLPPLNASLVLLGPFNDDPSQAVTPVLDLTGLQAWWPMTPNGQLYIHDLTITGLVFQPLPVLSGHKQQVEGSISSALPLAIFNFTDTSLLTSPVVWMHNVTLQLPVDDYQALAALAAYGNNPNCQDAGVTARAAQLQAGISSIEMTSASNVPNTLFFDTFVGWGLNSTQLWVSSMEAVQTPICTAGGAVQSDDSSSTSSSHKLVAAAVVGSVGGLLLITVAFSVALLMWRRRQQGHTKTAAKHQGQHSSKQTSLVPDTHGGQHVGGYGGLAMGSRLHDAVAHLQEQVISDLSLHYSVKGAGNPPVGHLGSPQGPSQLSLWTLSAVGEPGDASSSLQLYAQPVKGVSHAHSLDVAPQAQPMDSAGQVSCHNSPAAPSSIAITVDSLPADTASRVNLSGAAAAAVSHPSKQHMPMVQDIHQQAKQLNAAADQVVIVGLLGTGAQGTVYRGIWRGLPVALKTLVFESGPDPDTAGDGQSKSALDDRVIMEAAIAASVGHPNVVCTYLYDIKPMSSPQQDDSRMKNKDGLQVVVSDEVKHHHNAQTFKLFLVQELCTMSLNQVLGDAGLLHDPQTGKVDLVCVFAILLDAARGLEYLHSKGIIHGDLKPGNVLVKADPTRPPGVIAKLTDFGLSTHVGHAATHVSGFAAGTPFYVAPEVVRHHKVSPASDIFSFGVMMWQLYTGRPPYLANSQGQYAWNPFFPNFSPPNVPSPTFAQLVARCLSMTPQQRPSATALIESLTAAQAVEVAGQQAADMVADLSDVQEAPDTV